MIRINRKSSISLTCCTFFILMIWCNGAVDGVNSDDYDIIVSRMNESAMSHASHQSLAYLVDRLQPDGSFSDLPYGEDGSTSYSTHGRRQGALAYHYHNGEDTADLVILCFSFITYDAPPNPDNNWWGHLIGTPSAMWEGLALAKNIISTQLLKDFLQRYWVDTVEGAVWDVSDQTSSFAGGNFGPRALLGVVEGLVRDETFFPARHQEVKQELNRELVLRKPWGNDGLRPDGCLHQHSPNGNYSTEHGYLEQDLALIYNGNYGKEMLRYLAGFFPWFSQTSEDFDDDTIEGLFAAYLECNQWLFRGHTFEPTSTGRFITSGRLVTQTATKDGVMFTGNLLLQLGRHTPEVEAALHRYDNAIPDEDFALNGHKYFFNSDVTMHQRRNYMAGVRVLSNRTVRPETWFTANQKGYFQGDGFLTVLVDGMEYGEPKKEVFQVYDWALVPGVTNLYTQDIPQYSLGAYWAERFVNNAIFVGGVTDGMVGVTTMDYNRPHVPLTNLKSYFFFHDVLVVVASRITLTEPTGKDVITTLTQIMHSGEHVVGNTGGEERTLYIDSYTSEVSPAYLHHGNTGYVFLQSDHTLHLWANSRLLDVDTINVFTSWLSHGLNPQDDVLTYAVLPAADLNRTRDFYNNPEIDVLQVLPDTHVICHKPSQTVALVLSVGKSISITNCGQSGSIIFEVDVPCLSIITIEEETPDSANIKVSISDPQQTFTSVNINLTYEGRVQKKVIDFPPEPYKGSSISVTFNL